MRVTPKSILALNGAPRAHLFTVARSLSTRNLHTSPLLKKDDPSPFTFRGGPSPPRLPKEDQDLFESLQRQSTGAFSTPLSERQTPRINQSPDSTPEEVADARDVAQERAEKMASAAADGNSSTGEEQSSKLKDLYDKVIEARGKGEELHPNVRRGALPEFEGDVNPKTGEVGGPKNDPLRWGASGEWTYNGRATDF